MSWVTCEPKSMMRILSCEVVMACRSGPDCPAENPESRRRRRRYVKRKAEAVKTAEAPVHRPKRAGGHCLDCAPARQSGAFLAFCDRPPAPDLGVSSCCS